MAYNEKLADRVREALMSIKNLEEIKMFRGITFMVNGKMCVGVSGNELMCRINPSIHDEVVEKYAGREMIRGNKVLKGFVFIDDDAVKNKKNFDYCIKLCLDFNAEAKATKKPKKPAKRISK